MKLPSDNSPLASGALRFATSLNLYLSSLFLLPQKETQPSPSARHPRHPSNLHSLDGAAHPMPPLPPLLLRPPRPAAPSPTSVHPRMGAAPQTQPISPVARCHGCPPSCRLTSCSTRPTTLHHTGGSLPPARPTIRWSVPIAVSVTTRFVRNRRLTSLRPRWTMRIRMMREDPDALRPAGLSLSVIKPCLVGLCIDEIDRARQG